MTDAGRSVVRDAFGDTLNIRRVVGIVDRLRQVNPILSELDAFVNEASDVIHHLSPVAQKGDIDIRECRSSMPRKGTYFLAGIHVLREATRAGMITVNPSGCPSDQWYIKYNQSEYS